MAQTYLSGDNAVKIARSIEEAVADGHLGAGDLVPAVRAAAAQLRVSPATVSAAYRRLQARGILVADGRRGTRVRPASPIAVPPPPPLPAGVRDLASGNPDLALLPSLGGAVRYVPEIYRDDLNEPGLLAAARRAFEADGIDAAHVGIVSGALDGVERVLREHLRPGDPVAVEDPGFTGVLDLLAALSLVPIPVAIDDDGPLPDSLARAVRSAHAFIVTPRAQNPTGAAISERRARDLRRVLAPFPDLLVIEDDHAGPVAGAPHVSICGAADPTTARTSSPARSRRGTPRGASIGREVCSPRHWAVVRSVSKSFGPDLRLAFLAADPVTLARVEGRQTLGIRWVSHVLQRIVLALLRDRAATRLLQHAEAAYAERRGALIEALRHHGIEAHGRSGLNVWIPVPEEMRVVQGLLAKGWAVTAGERYRIASGAAIRVTIATLEPKGARRFADDLAEILTPAATRSRSV